MKRRRGLLFAVAVCLVLPQAAPGQRDILADDYRDKLYGMWLGELLGNYAGRPVEGHIQRGGLDYTVDWETASSPNPWWGDDDTCFEFLYTHVLNANPDPSSADIGQSWLTHVKSPAFFIANRQARWLMDQGVMPPQSGSLQRNRHWYAIDSQIATEALGGLSPGMRQRAADLAGRFASVTNEGFAVHASQFYAAMYAAAAFEPGVEQLVAMGLEVVPTSSRTYEIVANVQNWYEQDKADGQLDWRATHELIYDHYNWTPLNHGRYYGWFESSINTAMTTMAVLYGEGQFKQTVEIGVQAGFDADCNPATAGGLIGLIDGFSALPSDLTDGISQFYQASVSLQNIDTSRTLTEVVDGLQSAAEAQILLNGGSITGSGQDRTYHLPAADPIVPPPEMPDPDGPTGLVGEVLELGGTVTVSASVDRADPTYDRSNLGGIIDGITDVRYNGRRAYVTRDTVIPQPEGGDYYQLDFDRDLAFTSVIYYEGGFDMGGGPNSFPGDYEAQGGLLRGPHSGGGRQRCVVRGDQPYVQ